MYSFRYPEALLRVLLYVQTLFTKLHPFILTIDWSLRSYRQGQLDVLRHWDCHRPFPQLNR